jgi:hypothetical protein
MPPLPCMLVCAIIYLLHTRPRVQRAPGIPCALCLEGKEIRWQASGEWSREIVRSCLLIEIGLTLAPLPVIASAAKQSIVRRKKVWIASSLRSSQ